MIEERHLDTGQHAFGLFAHARVRVGEGQQDPDAENVPPTHEFRREITRIGSRHILGRCDALTLVNAVQPLFINAAIWTIRPVIWPGLSGLDRGRLAHRIGRTGRNKQKTC